jgi:tetratricopeptide (TPR) repeat protein
VERRPTPSYAELMGDGSRWRRVSPPQWAGELVYWKRRRAERRAGTPEEGLELAEQRLAKSLEKEGPNSGMSINAMERVAKFRETVGSYEDALPLRQQVVDLRRKHLGREHQLTLAAEARLAVTFIELQRPSSAKPLLVHVLSGLSANQQSDAQTVLAVTKRLADVEFALGESEDARQLLEQEMAHYDEQGEELLACGVATKLAEGLIRTGQYAEAPDLLRKVVETRSRLLGPEDPETLASLRHLALALVWKNDLAEASIVARNLLATSLQLKGYDDPDTLAAGRLVKGIDDQLSY